MGAATQNTGGLQCSRLRADSELMGGAHLTDWDTLDEAGRVHSWRLCRLLDLGYGLPAAEDLAASAVDVHALETLVVARGCSLELAQRILS